MTRPSGADAQRVRLRAAGVSLRSDQIIDDPVLSALLTEDLCWEIALADWARREPPRWRPRQRARWRAEDEALWQERNRIRAMAQQFGLPIV